MNRSKIILLLLILVLNVFLFSCKEDKDEPINNNQTQLVPDPLNSQLLTLPGNGTPISLGEGLYETNYLSFKDNQIGGVYCSIADLGEFQNLGSVNGKFPVTLNQWAIAQISHGYVVRFSDEYNTIYSRVFITKSVTGVDGSSAGLEIKYEYDWQEPFNVPIEIRSNEPYCTTYYKNGEMKWNYIWVQISYVMPVKASVQYDKTCEFIDDVKAKDNALIVCFDVEYMPDNWSGIFEVSNGISTKIIKLRRQGDQKFIFAD